MERPQLRGAGPAGGLLFVALLLFLGWLMALETVGLLRVVLLAVLGVAVAALTVGVLRRR